MQINASWSIEVMKSTHWAWEQGEAIRLIKVDEVWQFLLINEKRGLSRSR